MAAWGHGKWLGFSALLSIVWLLANVAIAEAASNVLPMIDTGGHTARITGILFSADGRYLVSGSDDKVVRVWDLQNGTMVRAVRGQAGLGEEGKIYAIALSPDGQLLAVGGWTGGDEIRLYNFATGTIVGLLKGHKNVVLSLAFSSDSKLLISAGFDRKAIIWDVAKREPLQTLGEHGASVSGAVFTADGTRAITTSFDKKLRVWRVSDGQLLAERAEHKDGIRALAISSATGMIATGGRGGEIRLWDKDATSSRLLVDQKQYVGALSFSPDGRLLLSTCAELAWFECRNLPPRVWEIASGRQVAAYAPLNDTVIASAISADGRWAATAGGFHNEIHVWDLKTGAKRWVLAGRGASVSAVGFSADSGQLGFGNTRKFVSYNDRGPIEYRMQLPIGGRQLGQPERIDAERAATFDRAHEKLGALSLAHLPNKAGDRSDGVLEVRRANQVLARIARGASDGYRHSTYGFAGADTILSGGSHGHLIAYRPTGEKVREFVGHEGDIWALAVSADGRFALSGADDQTLRLWNVATGELVVSLVVTRDNEWVVWTPQGYYTASAAGGALIGWQLNKGPDQAAEYVTSEQLRKVLNRPDIVERAIQLASADAAIREANPAGLDIANLFKLPQISIVSPRPGSATASGGHMLLVLRVSIGELPLKSMTIYVNGRKVRLQPVGVPADRWQTVPGTELHAYRVPLAAGENAVAVVAENEAGSTPLDTNKLNVWHIGEGELDVRGRLIILAIGVDKYPGLPAVCGRLKNARCDLHFAGADAKLFADTVARTAGPMHAGEPATRVLINDAGPNDQPTKANIEAALRAVETAGPLDTVALFFAGHGEQARGGKYFLLPTDAKREGTADPGTGTNLLDWQMIQGAVTSARARRLLFIDACHAGSAYAARGYNDKLSGDARADHFVAFVAAGPNQLAEEDPTKRHGLFTYVLAKGLRGDGGTLDPLEGTVRVYPLASFLSREVRRLTDGRQGPQVNSGYGDIVLVRQ